MTSRRRWLGGLLASGAATVASSATRDAPPLAKQGSAALDRTGESRLQALMQLATAPGGYLGAVTLIAQHGRVLHHAAWGQCDVARQQPMQADAIFRIYSMSKTVTAVAAMHLLELGKLALDDPLTAVLPEFSDIQVMADGSAEAPQLRRPARAITLRHLLTHTAGFATGAPGQQEATKLMERAAPQSAPDLAGYARRVAPVPLAHDPGTRFNYDGVNTEVLCRALEVIAGMPFAALLRQAVFEPLALRDTGFTVPPAQRHRIAELSTMGPDGRLVAGPGRSVREPGVALNDYSSGAGGLYSTAADYHRFAQMLLDGGRWQGTRVLNPRSVALMTGNHLGAALMPPAGLNPGEGMGLGVSVVLDPALRGRMGSAGAYGWSGAACTYYTVDPKEGLVALLLMQHLPRGDLPVGVRDLPRLQARWFNLAYLALPR